MIDRGLMDRCFNQPFHALKGLFDEAYRLSRNHLSSLIHFYNKAKTDILAIKAGIKGIAYPSGEVYGYAKTLGLDIEFHQKCCSLIWQDLSRESHIGTPHR